MESVRRLRAAGSKRTCAVVRQVGPCSQESVQPGGRLSLGPWYKENVTGGGTLMFVEELEACLSFLGLPVVLLVQERSPEKSPTILLVFLTLKAPCGPSVLSYTDVLSTKYQFFLSCSEIIVLNVELKSKI